MFIFFLRWKLRFSSQGASWLDWFLPVKELNFVLFFRVHPVKKEIQPIEYRKRLYFACHNLSGKFDFLTKKGIIRQNPYIFTFGLL
ncbi:hypothetical protein A3J20_03090 [Candidatus Gottesmanbacteria bacterium RIFCSPLOWO2_02_FULL_42_29]|uniref:Uncharacterized protein n=1 Tax=Candidatus Gottesmanbacteria bacterium RIFCSPLOWO2_01_FULL_42_22 TaxID=1798391 RepID=A0A1F6B837_9BACT|nr:MAG: hypothetical protein A2781_01985 [Candidatus Gottesmanbacteria bacterium RIFCSPHIGHO2_01_FULL_42_27]OGG19993.1 MAG: hypothetical protein A3E72_01365 [Candidatus Gottesmanbacteria bacterium RIFCSPHIGHO2_12_FULL_43_26]OGG32943.1 MAG: hypothetical protein A2968_06775 [Candidatus Gottesmanbacteria bacterium RIFCSPLOWO2_01_FULL_42_22]OGG34781.1 MAG: hypothetical protein A3G68_06380 [Candidatus Gottesmanbacteria bacterium RIFCSPLOWO2_12_FULL_42_10]OGG36952.1 MAG: hypothetical protein A3J20_03